MWDRCGEERRNTGEQDVEDTREQNYNTKQEINKPRSPERDSLHADCPDALQQLAAQRSWDRNSTCWTGDSIKVLRRCRRADFLRNVHQDFIWPPAQFTPPPPSAAAQEAARAVEEDSLRVEGGWRMCGGLVVDGRLPPVHLQSQTCNQCFHKPEPELVGMYY